MNEKLLELSSVVHETIDTLEQTAGELQQALDLDVPKLGRTNRSALIVAGLIDSYYTRLETGFLRISQHFENNLLPDKWHRDLLEKMQLTIGGVRIAAVSKENAGRLDELLRFRHFRRYYFQIDYDWRKLDFLCALLFEAQPVVKRDLLAFDTFLSEI